jgi:hypothetical protein
MVKTTVPVIRGGASLNEGFIQFENACFMAQWQHICCRRYKEYATIGGMRIIQIAVGPNQVPLTGYLQDITNDGGDSTTSGRRVSFAPEERTDSL